MTGFATWNSADKSADFVLSGGDLVATTSGGAGFTQNVRATIGKSSGKWYYEVVVTGTNLGSDAMGVGEATVSMAAGQIFGASAVQGVAIGKRPNGTLLNTGGSTGNAVTWTFGDTVSVLWDANAGTVTFWVNGVAAGTVSGVAGGTALYPIAGYNPGAFTSHAFTANFGASAFTYTPPAGYVGWDDGTMNVNLTAPAPILASQIGYGAAVLTAPAPIIDAQAAFNVLTAVVPAPTMSATVVSSPLITVVLASPAPVLTSVGTVGSVLSSALLVPAPSVAASGISGNVSTADLLAPAPMLVGVGVNSILLTASLSVPAPRALAAVLTGAISTAVLRAVAPIMAAAGYPAYTITAALGVPAPQLQAALGAAVIAAYRTWVLNTRKNCLTEYGPEFAFNSFARFNGQDLACGSSGIVVLGLQGQDNATAIDARLRTGQQSFASSFHKRVPRIYTSGSFAGDMLFRTITTEGGTRTYALPFNGITGIQQRRVPVGKGPKSRLWQFEVENVNGCDFGQNDMLIYTTQLRRRVQ